MIRSNIPVCERLELSGHTGLTCLHEKLLPRHAVDTQHHMLSFAKVPRYATVNMHPSHLWFDSRSKTDMILIYDQSIRRPQLRRRLGMRCEDFCFCGTFNCNPTAAKVSTSVSRTMPTKSNKIVIGAKQESVICKLQVQHSPAMIATITQIQTQMLHFIAPIRHRHFRHGCSVITRLTPSGHKSDIRTSVQKLSTPPPASLRVSLCCYLDTTPFLNILYPYAAHMRFIVRPCRR